MFLGVGIDLLFASSAADTHLGSGCLGILDRLAGHRAFAFFGCRKLFEASEDVTIEFLFALTTAELNFDAGGLAFGINVLALDRAGRIRRGIGKGGSEP